MKPSNKSTGNVGFSAWMPLLVAIALGLGMVVGMQLGDVKVIQLEGGTEGGKFEIGRVEEVLRFIESHYVDSVQGDELKRAAIDGMLEKLDPHTKYLTPEELVFVNRDMYNSYTGLGIVPRTIGDSVFVSFVFEGSPAEAGGIRIGDKIISINGHPVDTGDMSFEEDRGTKDTVHLTLERMRKPFTVDMLKTKITLDEIPAHYMLNDSICYIKIDRFGEDAYKIFMQAFEKLSSLGCNDLIIDVRDNSGGYLNEAVKIISQLFYEKDLPIAWAEGVHSPRKIFRTKGRPFFDVKDIVVLVDEQTASASEILAGALQDLSRGVIVGRRTFGKGLVQEHYELPEGYALRITTARYYLPSGRSIQRDYQNGNDAYRDKWYDRLYSGELLSKDSIPRLDSSKYFTKKGKLVHGKSGIVPDVFVPYKRFELNPDWSSFCTALDDYIVAHFHELRRDFTFEGISDSEAVIEAPVDQLLKINPMDNAICDSIINRVLRRNPEWSSLLTSDDSQDIKAAACHYVYSSLLYCMGDKNAFYKYENKEDPMVNKAFELLHDSKTDSLLMDTTNNRDILIK